MSPNLEHQVDAVILDLGNVLVFHDNEQLFRTFAEYAGLSVDAVSRRISEPMWNAIHSGELDSNGIRREICQTLGLKLSPDAFDRAWNCHFTPNRDVLPHVEALLGQVKLLLLSNTNPIHTAYLMKQLPILGRFDYLVLSHQIGKMKPDPAVFHEALRLAGTAPSRTAFFDDVSKYVEAARQVGIRAYLFREVDQFVADLANLGLR